MAEPGGGSALVGEEGEMAGERRREKGGGGRGDEEGEGRVRGGR